MNEKRRHASKEPIRGKNDAWDQKFANQRGYGSDALYESPDGCTGQPERPKSEDSERGQSRSRNANGKRISSAFRNGKRSRSNGTEIGNAATAHLGRRTTGAYRQTEEWDHFFLGGLGCKSGANSCACSSVRCPATRSG